jgi:hypothetical protein
MWLFDSLDLHYAAQQKAAACGQWRKQQCKPTVKTVKTVKPVEKRTHDFPLEAADDRDERVRVLRQLLEMRHHLARGSEASGGVTRGKGAEQNNDFAWWRWRRRFDVRCLCSAWLKSSVARG